MVIVCQQVFIAKEHAVFLKRSLCFSNPLTSQAFHANIARMVTIEKGQP